MMGRLRWIAAAGALATGAVVGQVATAQTGLPAGRTGMLLLGALGAKQRTIPFVVTLDGGGAEKSIATNGPLEVFVRCELDRPDPYSPYIIPTPRVDIVSIIVTSTEGPWFSTSFEASDPLLAGDEVALVWGNIVAASADYRAPDIANSHGSALASDGSYIGVPDGSYIGVPADTVGFGANILGHDCIAVGQVLLIKGNFE